MKIVIDGTVFKGHGVASKNIKFQLPHLVWQFPEIKDVFPASINVLLDAPLHNPIFDYTTLPTPWWDVVDESSRRWGWAVEKFSFLRIGFECPLSGPMYRAWIFGCHNSQWFPDPLRFEIITEKIPDISYGTRCRIHIEKEAAR
jgi:hypothetical protein